MVIPGTVSRRALAAAGAIGADRLIGEPLAGPHPVAVFGQLMRAVERRVYRDALLPGVAFTIAGTACAGMAGAAVHSTALAAWVAQAGRGLARAAAAVAGALEDDDIEAARHLLPALVGRDPEGMDEKEVVRAVVESVAENTVDAVVAPALWAALAGPAGALVYRAANTLDSMVGHRSDRYRNFGKPSARLDDAAGWLPARVTAGLVAAVRPAHAFSVWDAVRRQAPAHPSPNAGVAEAAFAAALDVRLGGTNRYGGTPEVRPSLGFGRPPERRDIARAVRLSGDAATALAVALALPAAVRRLRPGGRR